MTVLIQQPLIKIALWCSLFTLLFASACTIEDSRDFPNIELSRQLELNFEDGSVCIGQSIKAQLFINQGDTKLTQLEIYENTKLIPTERLTIQSNGNFINENPILLASEERTELTFDVEIQPDPMDTVGTVKTYFFKILDANNQPAIAAFTIEHKLPTIELVPSSNFIHSDTSLFVCNDLKMKLQLEACWQDLQTLEILENGTLANSNNLSISSIFEETVSITQDSSIVVADTVLLASENPVNIAERDKVNAMFDVFIKPTGAIGGGETYQYDFLLTNARGQVDTATIKIVTNAGTPFEFSDNLRLYNEAGGDNSGGLDFDTGTRTGANDVNADVQDEGVRFQGQDVVWRKQISVVNTSDSIRYYPAVRKIKVDEFCYKEQLAAAFEAALPLDGDDELEASLVSDKTIQENVSNPVDIGDVFVLRKGASMPFTYYLFECTDVNDPANNENDYYEFLVKF